MNIILVMCIVFLSAALGCYINVTNRVTFAGVYWAIGSISGFVCGMLVLQEILK